MLPHEVRFQAFKTADDDGSHAAPVSSAKINNLVTGVNNIYGGAGVKVVFDPATDLTVLRSTVLNRDFTLFADPAGFKSEGAPPHHDRRAHDRARLALADPFPDRLVVFFDYREKLVFDDSVGHWKVELRGGSSSWASSYIHMPGSGGDERTLPQGGVCAGSR